VLANNTKKLYLDNTNVYKNDKNKYACGYRQEKIITSWNNTVNEDIRGNK
jgi:hypothetical protein